MTVTLINKYSNNALNIGVGSARTCYSPNIVFPEKNKDWERKEDLVKDLYKAGHHTTLQHTHFTFAISGISRLALWRFFHAHRFYNSDQQSQRYTVTDVNNFYTPKHLSKEDSALIESLHSKLLKGYDMMRHFLEENFKQSDNPVERRIAKKKALENARYILPQTMKANLYHTVNLSTLLRYAVVKSSIPDATEEIELAINQMIQEVVSDNPDLVQLFENIETIDKETTRRLYPKKEPMFAKENIEIISHSCNPPEYHADYNFYSHESGISALFNQPESSFTFTTRYAISLSADAQGQRHRTSLGIRPVLSDISVASGNFIDRQYVPQPIKNNTNALQIFYNCINHIYDTINQMRDKSVVPYLLPNSFQFMLDETTNYQDFVHKSEKRLCLNSQEEIRCITENIVSKLSEIVEEKDLFAPPCVLRHRIGKRPICPEGSRFCGIKEWKKDKYKTKELK